MMGHLARHLPYDGTSIEAYRTKAEIDCMLHEFRMVDNETNMETAKITAIRWTDVPPDMPMLEFMLQYVSPEGVKKGVAIRLQPPLFYKRVRRGGQIINEPQPNQSMRILYWYLKSKLEAILYGMNDATKEFLSEVLLSLPDGQQRTVGDQIIDQIRESKIPSLPAPREVPQ